MKRLILTILTFFSYLQAETPQESAEIACKEIYKKYPDTEKELGLSKEELFKIVLYIENELHTKEVDCSLYLRKEKTDLARTVEYDAETKHIFIHLKKHGVKGLGKGCHKSVTRSLLYCRQNPELVANSVLYDENAHELELAKKLKKIPGIAETISVSCHEKKDGKKVFSLIQKLYNGGSLGKNKNTLSKKEKLTICRDVLYGLEKLHKKNYVHCDLHGSNILLHKDPDNQMTAVLIDLGHALAPELASKRAPKVQAPKRCNPPETLSEDSDTIDAKKVDVYAVGLALYKFYFNQPPEWIVTEEFVNMRRFTPDEKAAFQKKLTERLKKGLKMRRKAIKKENSSYLKLEKVLLKLCRPDPKKRYSARKARKKFDHGNV